jgi:hypothetical protein
MAVNTRKNPITKLIVSWSARAFAVATIICAAHADDSATKYSDHAAAVAVFAPQVEFLSMETDAHIDAPKADVDTISRALAEQISLALSERQIDERRINRLIVEETDGAPAYDDIVKGIKRGRGQGFENAAALMSDLVADHEILIVRARFYLD